MVHVFLNDGNDSRTTRHSITFSSVESPYLFTLTLAHRFLASFLDLVSFLYAGGLALTVTTLRPAHRRLFERQQGLGDQQSQFTGYQRQFLGRSEKERE